jgi:hypothetical protein
MYNQTAVAAEWLPELDIDPPERQRRLTVLLRLLLLIPQFIVLAALGIAVFVVAVIGWFAALFLGRLPGWAADFLSGYVGYATRVEASESLLVDKYPPFSFSAPGYPVRVELRPGELNRLAVLLRVFLAIPAAVIYAVVSAGWEVCSFFIWLIVLILGRMPEPLFEATAAITRYSMRLQAYWLMLTAAYPKRLFGDGTGDGTGGGMTRASATRPLLLTTAGRLLLVVFIVIGLGYTVFGSSGSWTSSSAQTTSRSQP